MGLRNAFGDLNLETTQQGVLEAIRSSKDFFGNQVMSQRVNQVEVPLDDVDWETYVDVVSQQGTATQNDGQVTFSTGTNANGFYSAISNDAVKYRPGNEIGFGFTFRFSGVTAENSYQRIGAADDISWSNGVWFGYENTVFGISYSNNGVVEDFVTQSEWMDPCDGSEGSLYTENGLPVAFDPTKAQLARIRAGLFGQAGFLVELYTPDGEWLTVYRHRHINNALIPVFSNFDLSIAVEVRKQGAADENLQIFSSCWAGWTAISHKRLDDLITDRTLAEVTRTVIEGKTSAGGGAYVPVKVNPSGSLEVNTNLDQSISNLLELEDSSTYDRIDTRVPLANGEILDFTVDPTTDEFFSSGHGLTNNDRVVFSGDTLSSEIDPTVAYYALVIDSDRFKISTFENGQPVDIVDQGTAPHTFQRRGNFTSDWIDLKSNSDFYFAWISSTDAASITLDFSDDGISHLNTGSFVSDIDNVEITQDEDTGVWFAQRRPFQPAVRRYVRFNITNGATDQIFHEAVFWKLKESFNGTFSGLEDPLSFIQSFLLTRSVNIGTTFAGEFKNAQLEENAVDANNFQQTPLENDPPVAFTVSSGVITSPAHGLLDGDIVHLEGTDGFIIDDTYQVVNATENTFQIQESPQTGPLIFESNLGTEAFVKRALYIGEFSDCSQAGHGLLYYISNTKPQITVEYSDDGIIRSQSIASSATVTVNEIPVEGIGTIFIAVYPITLFLRPFLRMRVINGPENQILGLSEGAILIGKGSYPGTFTGLEEPLSIFQSYLLTRSVNIGRNPDDQFVDAAFQGQDSGNTTTELLPADTGIGDNVYRGEWFPWQEKYVGLVVSALSDVQGQLVVELSQEAEPINGTDESVTSILGPILYNPDELELLSRTFPIQSKFYRIKWVNGVEPQTQFSLSSALLTTSPAFPLQPLVNLPNQTTVGQTVNSVLLTKDEGDFTFSRVENTSNSEGKKGVNTHITGQENSIIVKEEVSSRVSSSQRNVGAGSPVLLDIDKLPGRKKVRIKAIVPPENVATVTSQFVAVGFSSDMTFRSGSELLSTDDPHLEFNVDESVDFYAITYDNGQGSTTESKVEPAVAPTGTATTPGNAQLSDDQYAIIDADGENIVFGEASFVDPLTTEESVESIVFEMEANKDESLLSPISFENVVTNTAGDVTQVAVSGVTSSPTNLYVLSVGWHDPTQTITGVNSNMGFTALELVGDTGSAASDEARHAVYLLRGVPNQDGVVGVTFSGAVDFTTISVAQYSGHDPINTIGGSQTDGSDGAVDNYNILLDGSRRGVRVVSGSMELLSHNEAAGFTERAEFGASVNNDIESFLADAPIDNSGQQSLSGSFVADTANADFDFAVVAFTINPETPVDPLLQIDVFFQGNPVYSEVTRVDDTNDRIYRFDITGAREWSAADLAQTSVNITGLDVDSQLPARVDQGYIQLTESSGPRTFVSIYQEA